MNLDRVIAVRTNKTVYRDGDKCIKVFDSDYSKADVLNEALNQARIEETGLNIPKVLEVCTIEGKWAIVSEYIKGKTLSQLMQEHPEKKDEYLRLFVETQLLVQSKTCPLLSRLKAGDKLVDGDVVADLYRVEGGGLRFMWALLAIIVALAVIIAIAGTAGDGSVGENLVDTWNSIALWFQGLFN